MQSKMPTGQMAPPPGATPFPAGDEDSNPNDEDDRGGGYPFVPNDPAVAGPPQDQRALNFDVLNRGQPNPIASFLASLKR